MPDGVRTPGAVVVPVYYGEQLEHAVLENWAAEKAVNSDRFYFRIKAWAAARNKGVIVYVQCLVGKRRSPYQEETVRYRLTSSGVTYWLCGGQGGGQWVGPSNVESSTLKVLAGLLPSAHMRAVESVATSCDPPHSPHQARKAKQQEEVQRNLWAWV